MSPIIPFSLLIVSALIGVIHLLVASGAKAWQHKDIMWLIGPRDEPKPATGMAARLDRSYANFIETYPYFVIAMLTFIIGGLIEPYAVWGACIYILARVLYIPSYAFGWIIRTPVWALGFLGLMTCYVQLVAFIIRVVSQPVL
jgi:uncharacterized MAPEG superfamily protein